MADGPEPFGRARSSLEDSEVYKSVRGYEASRASDSESRYIIIWSMDRCYSATEQIGIGASLSSITTSHRLASDVVLSAYLPRSESLLQGTSCLWSIRLR